MYYLSICFPIGYGILARVKGGTCVFVCVNGGKTKGQSHNKTESEKEIIHTQRLRMKRSLNWAHKLTHTHTKKNHQLNKSNNNKREEMNNISVPIRKAGAKKNNNNNSNLVHQKKERKKVQEHSISFDV